MPAARTPARYADADQLLTLAEVGQQLGVSAVTAWRRVRGGELPAINVGARGSRPQLRVRSSAIEKYLREREVRPLPRGAGRRAA